MRKNHGSYNTQTPGNYWRAEEGKRGQQVGNEKQQAERLELHAETQEEPIREQSTRESRAEVVDEGENRHFGDKYPGFLGEGFFNFLRTMLFADGAVDKEQND